MYHTSPGAQPLPNPVNPARVLVLVLVLVWVRVRVRVWVWVQVLVLVLAWLLLPVQLTTPLYQNCETLSRCVGCTCCML